MLNYLIGDATEPQVDDGLRIIAHCCNDIGAFGSGFVACLNKKWPHVREQYVKWSQNNLRFFGGMIQVVPVEKNIYIANMIGQHGVVGPNNPKPVNYEWIFECMRRLDDWVVEFRDVKTYMGTNFEPVKVSIHCPRFGAGLAGGAWNTIELLINIAWQNQDVYVYDLP